MSKHNKIILLLITLFFSSCYRRELEEVKQVTALIPISVDWSQSGIDVSTMNAFSVWFFPEDGGDAIYKVSNDLYNAEIALPVGKYSVILFNETINNNDWNCIGFRGIDRFETFEAYTRTIAPPSYFPESESNEITSGCDQLAIWSYEHFIVSADMIEQSRASRSMLAMKSKPFQQAVASFQHIQPKMVCYQINVSARIENLSSAGIIYGSIHGVSNSINLATATNSNNAVSHYFEFTERTWEDKEKNNGTTFGKVLFLGKRPNQENDYRLKLLPIMYWDNKEDQFYEYDISEKLNTSAKVVEIQLGLNPIIRLKKSNGGIQVGDWENEEVIIN